MVGRAALRADRCWRKLLAVAVRAVLNGEAPLVAGVPEWLGQFVRYGDWTWHVFYFSCDVSTQDGQPRGPIRTQTPLQAARRIPLWTAIEQRADVIGLPAAPYRVCIPST